MNEYTCTLIYHSYTTGGLLPEKGSHIWLFWVPTIGRLCYKMFYLYLNVYPLIHRSYHIRKLCHCIALKYAHYPRYIRSFIIIFMCILWLSFIPQVGFAQFILINIHKCFSFLIPTKGRLFIAFPLHITVPYWGCLWYKILLHVYQQLRETHIHLKWKDSKWVNKY